MALKLVSPDEAMLQKYEDLRAPYEAVSPYLAASEDRWLLDGEAEWGLESLLARLADRSRSIACRQWVGGVILQVCQCFPTQGWEMTVGSLPLFAECQVLTADAAEAAIAYILGHSWGPRLCLPDQAPDIVRALLSASGLNERRRLRLAVASLCEQPLVKANGDVMVRMVETSELSLESRLNALWRPIRNVDPLKDLLEPARFRDGVVTYPQDQNYYLPHRFSTTVIRYCAPALARLGEEPDNILAAATAVRSRQQTDIDAGWLGALDVVDAMSLVTPAGVQCLDRGLRRGSGAVRKRAYQVAAKLRGPVVWKQALHDSNRLIRTAAEVALGSVKQRRS